MANGFATLKVCADTVERLRTMGINKPMPVQEQAIPALLAGRDVIARAQTGTGKTLAFLVPLAEKIDVSKDYAQALVLTPTRELAEQIARELGRLLAGSHVKALAVTGGRDFDAQKYKLDGRSHVLIGTPGRLLDHVKHGNADLGGVTYLVLDEVDEMLEQGFSDDALELIDLTSQGRQTMLCSATLPEEVRKFARKLTVNAALIDIDPAKATVDKIKQICIKVDEENKNQAVASLIARLQPYLMLVFCMSKERATKVGDWLAAQGFNVDVLQGDMSSAKRKTVMKAFRDAKIQILVASDIAARGLDVEGVTHVINYDIPRDAAWYVHRIGRTGRAGNDGTAITFYTPDELKWLGSIESKLGVDMERQSLEGKTLARRKLASSAKKSGLPKRGRSSVSDKRHAPKTGSNRRQGTARRKNR